MRGLNRTVSAEVRIVNPIVFSCNLSLFIS